MKTYEEQYLDILKKLLTKGVSSKNRTGIDTYKIWGEQIHIDLNQGFPLLTTKKMHIKSVIHELLWMIKGDTNIQYLLKNGVTFWTEWPYKQYLQYWTKHGCSITYEGQDIGYWDRSPDGKSCARSSRPLTQKEFEDRIINDDKFSQQFGSIGKYAYGALWREFPAYKTTYVDSRHEFRNEYEKFDVDQLSNVIDLLKTDPDSRRIIMSIWHPYHSNRIEDALLPACHNYIQFGTEELALDERIKLIPEIERNRIISVALDAYDKQGTLEDETNKLGIPKHRLNCYFNMRSVDTFLGLKFNVAFYSLLTHLIANQLNMIPNKVVFSGADVHLYANHIEQAKLQLTREPRKLPMLNIKTKGKSIFDIEYNDIEILDYNPHPAIKADIAV